MSADPIVIVGMARTPMGGFNGVLSDATGPELGASAIRAALERSGVPSADVDEVIMGCVLTHGQRQGPARQASLNAGLPAATGCTTAPHHTSRDAAASGAGSSVSSSHATSTRLPCRTRGGQGALLPSPVLRGQRGT